MQQVRCSVVFKRSLCLLHCYKEVSSLPLGALDVFIVVQVSLHVSLKHMTPVSHHCLYACCLLQVPSVVLPLTLSEAQGRGKMCNTQRSWRGHQQQQQQQLWCMQGRQHQGRCHML
jgi:hypothetical protein